MCIYNPGGKAEIYKLPLKKQTIKIGVFDCNIFKTNKKQEKVIMMVGASGAGKTTLINRMINYIFGVNYNDTFRFQIDDEIAKTQTKSQTMDIYKYTICHKKLPYKYTIIDTPGINATEGKKEDRQTLEKIKHLFESGAIEAVHAICMVEKYDTIRLTKHQIYIYETILQIFGKDAGQVIVIMVTHSPDIDTLKPPPVLELLEKQGIPFKKHFSFDNSGIYEKPTKVTPNTPYLTKLQAEVKKVHWDIGTKSFEFFFEILGSTIPISLKLTKEILREKYNIKNAQLPHLIRTLKTNIHEIETLEQDRKITEQMINNPDTSKFTVKAEETRPTLVDITEPKTFSTRCKNCDIICHYPCDIHKDNYILNTTKWCTAMTRWRLNPFNPHCTVCKGKCSWADHEQIRKKIEFKKVIVEHTDETLKESYINDKEGRLDAVKKKCEEKMLSAYNKVVKDFKDIQSAIQWINENSLSNNPTTINEYVDEVIELEEEAKEDGFEQRIYCLKELVEMKEGLSQSNDVQRAIAFIQRVQSKNL